MASPDSLVLLSAAIERLFITAMKTTRSYLQPFMPQTSLTYFSRVFCAYLNKRSPEWTRRYNNDFCRKSFRRVAGQPRLRSVFMLSSICLDVQNCSERSGKYCPAKKEGAVVIKLNELCMCYPSGVTALQPTSITFREGDLTVLLGSSGAGKSTLLRCLNFLNRPTSGEIVMKGLGVLNGDRNQLREHRCRTAMIFQQHQLIPRFSALKNVLIGRIPKYGTLRSLFPLPKHEQAFALECLDRVGLLDKALERVANLSGGQQQRVGIARALAQKPCLILADEPVASLDPATANHVLSLLQANYQGR